MAAPESTNTEEAEETTRAAAEEACRRAEELYLAGHFAGAYRHARRAHRLFPALPGIANALAAYGVHAVAAASPDRPNWYAILTVEQQRVATTHEAIKRQFRRLSLLVHPDKRSAAAEGAFKILREACDALLSDGSHHHPDPTAAASRSSGRRRSHTPAQAPAAGDADADTQTSRSRPPASAEAMPCTYRRIYCWHCKREFGRQVGPVEERVGAACPRCNRRLWPPWDRETLLDFATLESFAQATSGG